MGIQEQYPPKKVLVNWNALAKALPHMSEKELTRALSVELHGKRRKDFVLRLHRKSARLRKIREYTEYGL